MTESVNWAALMEQSGGAFEPLPKNTYDVIVDKADATTSSTNKTMFKIVFKVEGGPYNGRTIYNNITLSPENPNALRMFFLNMKCFGLDSAFFAQNPNNAYVAASMVGRQATVVIDHREYQGQMRENVKTLMPRAGGISAGPVPPAGPSAAFGGPSIPAPGSNPLVPSMTTSAAPVVSQPAPTVAAAPAPTMSTANIPMPSNPAPAAPAPTPVQMPTPMPMPPIQEPKTPEYGDYGTLPGEEPAPVPTVLNNMSPEMLAQFQAFQAAQAAAVQPAQPSAPQVPAGAPPLPDGVAF